MPDSSAEPRSSPKPETLHVAPPHLPMRLAFRQLVKSPGFTLVAVATLALGIGANTAIFSVINAALLRPLPYPDPQQLVHVWSTQPTGEPFSTITGAAYKQWRDHATLLDSIAIARPIGFNLTGDGPAQRIDGLEVSARFLHVFRVQPHAGRDFTPEEDQVGYDGRVVILSYEWWQSAFGGDRSLVGRTIQLNTTPFTVVGVLPPRALAQGSPAFLVPLAIDEEPWRTAPDSAWANAVARLKPGVTLAQAQAELAALNRDLYDTLPSSVPHYGVSLRPLQQQLAATSRPALLLLLAAVALVLLIACANVANLLLARAATRQKEMALRVALGANHRRIMGQVLGESVLLAGISGVVGVLVAALAMNGLTRMLANHLPAPMQPTLDLRVLAFSLIVACGTGLLFGIFPALRARRTDLNRDLRDGGRSATAGSRTKSQSLLVIAEIALTMTLLVGTGLLLRSFSKILSTDPGFNPSHALTFDLSVIPQSFENTRALIAYEREVVRRLGELPGIDSVGLTTTVPLNDAWGGLVRAATSSDPRDDIVTDVDFVDGGYFRSMGIALRRGRVFSDTDLEPDAPRVAIINERLAELLFPNENPLGRLVRMNDVDWEVVGVVNNVRQRQLDTVPAPHVYRVHSLSPYNTCVVARTTVSPAAVMEDIRRTMTAIDPDQSVANLRTLDHIVGEALQQRRLTLGLISVFAAVALVLACLGIYGVIAYTISQRQREFSIRLALGAPSRAVVFLILKDGLRLAAMGILAGIAGGAILARLAENQLYNVDGLDPLVLTGVSALLGGVAALATLIPALRVTRVDALSALRAE